MTIPEALRVGHEAHFAQVTATFLATCGPLSTLPAWERPNMLAKYYVTTQCHGAEPAACSDRGTTPRTRLRAVRSRVVD